MSKFWPIAAFLAASALGVPAAAAGAPVCGPRSEILTQLARSFSEAPSAVGLTSNGELLQVLTSVDQATWSIVISRPDGVSCIVAVGEEWQERRRLARKEERIM